MEKDMRDSDSMPQAVKEYIRNSAFEVGCRHLLAISIPYGPLLIGNRFMTHQAKKRSCLPGNSVTKSTHPSQTMESLEHQLTEECSSIRVAFSIEDLNNVDEDPDQLQDSAMMDELDDPSDMPQSAQSGGANTKGAVNQGRTSGGNIRVGRDNNNSPADRPELDDESNSDEQQDPSFPAHVFVTIKRAGKGALQIEAIAQDGLMAIENVYYYKDAKLADPESINSDWEARTVYSGPPFGNLDEDLQVLFERYLEERGINTTMALFVPDYIDYKEQREYLSWLESTWLTFQSLCIIC